jgi:hypothetical protein
LSCVCFSQAAPTSASPMKTRWLGALPLGLVFGNDANRFRLHREGGDLTPIFAGDLLERADPGHDACPFLGSGRTSAASMRIGGQQGAGGAAVRPAAQRRTAWSVFLVSRGTAARRGKKVGQAPLRQAGPAQRLADRWRMSERPCWCGQQPGSAEWPGPPRRRNTGGSGYCAIERSAHLASRPSTTGPPPATANSRRPPQPRQESRDKFANRRRYREGPPAPFPLPSPQHPPGP